MINYFKEKEVPLIIYYILPYNKQEAFQKYVAQNHSLPITDQLCQELISLPIRT